jgi:hypothetical protein
MAKRSSCAVLATARLLALAGVAGRLSIGHNGEDRPGVLIRVVCGIAPILANKVSELFVKRRQPLGVKVSDSPNDTGTIVLICRCALEDAVPKAIQRVVKCSDARLRKESSVGAEDEGPGNRPIEFLDIPPADACLN